MTNWPKILAENSDSLARSSSALVKTSITEMVKRRTAIDNVKSFAMQPTLVDLNVSSALIAKSRLIQQKATRILTNLPENNI